MSSPPLPDHEAFIQREIERAVAPYRNIAPPSLLAMLRDVAERYWRTHPQAVAIARALTQPSPDRSHATERDQGRAPTRRSPPPRGKK